MLKDPQIHHVQACSKSPELSYSWTHKYSVSSFRGVALFRDGKKRPGGHLNSVNGLIFL